MHENAIVSSKDDSSGTLDAVVDTDASLRIVRVEAIDARFPTSDDSDGSDAMHPDPDCSCVYVTLHTAGGQLQGNGLTFTLGRGNEVVLAAVNTLAPLVTGLLLHDITSDFASFWRRLASDGQVRWLGPEKGVIHMALAAVVNAVWDLWAKSEGKPLWRLLCDLTPEELVGTIDFRWISDVLTPEEAVSLLRERRAGAAERIALLEEEGYPAYTTSCGWLGYSEDKMRALCRAGLEEGWTTFKIKVGADAADDRRHLAIMREELGSDVRILTDANQRWDVGEAIDAMTALAEFRPYFIEEPTSCDDILGHATIRKALAPVGIRVATGEVAHNRVMFKQFFQAGSIDVCQIDSCRMGGVNEIVSVILMAAKFGIPVCPHAGGVGLCEMVQHFSMFDYVAVSGTTEDRFTEYVDHLHEHFVDPCVCRAGRYLAPSRPGFSTEMRAETLADYEFPRGRMWPRRLETIDTHVQLIDQEILSYPWLRSTRDRAWTIDDYESASGGCNVAKLVFVEVDCAAESSIAEAKWALLHPRVNAVCANAPVHLGAAATVEHLGAIAHPKLRSVRRLVKKSDPALCLSEAFVDGVRAVGEHGLVFELCCSATALRNAVKLFSLLPDLTFILNVEPAIKVRQWNEWARSIVEAGALPNVVCKISGAVAAVDDAAWTMEHVSPSVKHCLMCFGYERCMFGGDWFVVAPARCDSNRWFDAVCAITRELGATSQQQRDLFYNTASRVYRI